MKRALSALGALVAFVVLPGTGAIVILIGLAAAWRYCFKREETVTEPTLRRIRRESEQAARVRELVEMPRGRRTVLDGPPPTSALTKPWSGN